MKLIDSPVIQFTSLVLLALPCVILAWGWRSNSLESEIRYEYLIIAGRTRKWRTVIPHSATTPMPVVFAFHGVGDDMEGMASYSGLDQLAVQSGFLLVYPSTENPDYGIWNIDNSGSNFDMEFFDRMLNALRAKYDIDRSRVYCIGMSQGASFVHLLATKRANKIAAVVMHSGFLSRFEAGENSCPMMLIAG
ncbi:MAG: phospholipase, partial [Planctomycetaceae bacterium]|nr:phospholipase [Planctomycetaceae bacterium]